MRDRSRHRSLPGHGHDVGTAYDAGRVQSLASVRAPGATPLPHTGEPGLAVTTLRIKVGENWYNVEVGELTHSPVEVTVEGETFLVEVEGLPSTPPARPRRGRTDRKSTR